MLFLYFSCLSIIYNLYFTPCIIETLAIYAIWPKQNNSIQMLCFTFAKIKETQRVKCQHKMLYPKISAKAQT